MARIFGIGAATLDHLFITPEFSAEEAVQQASQSTQDGGGPVATALCVLSQLGHLCSLLDSQGDDSQGQAIRSGLARFGVSTQHILISPGATSPHAYIHVRARDGARQISYLPSSAPEPSAELARMLMAYQPWDWLYLNGRHETAALAAANEAQRRSIPLAFDGGAGRYRPSLRPLVKQSQLIILSHDFAQHYLGRSASALDLGSELYPSLHGQLVITCGLSGSHVWTKEGCYHHEPAHSIPVVDTTGCGDVYHAAYLHGHIQHWTIKDCARFASLAAADTARGLGGRFALHKGLLTSLLQSTAIGCSPSYNSSAELDPN